MAALRDVHSALLEANFNKIIDDEEFLLLWDLNEPITLIILTGIMIDLIWITFLLKNAEFRFKKDHLYEFPEVLRRIPEETFTHNRLKLDGMEALCILLKRLAVFFYITTPVNTRRYLYVQVGTSDGCQNNLVYLLGSCQELCLW